MVNPSLDRQFTLTNFKWNLRTQGHLNAEKLGACNYLKLSRIPVDIRLYWNKTNNRETAFSLDELVRGFKIDDRDEAGNAKTLNNIFLWSEGNIPQEPLSDLIELEYNGEGAMITPLLGNKSGAIDKIEKVSVVSTLDRVLNPIKVVSGGKVDGYTVSDFYRFNANSTQPKVIYAILKTKLTEAFLYPYMNNPYPGATNLNLTFNGTLVAEAAGGFYTYNKLALGFIDVYDFNKNKMKEDFYFGFFSDNITQDFRTWYRGANVEIRKEKFYAIGNTYLDSTGADRGNMSVSYWLFNKLIKENVQIETSETNKESAISIQLISNRSSINALPREIFQNYDNLIIGSQKGETTTSALLNEFIFKTQNTITSLAPKQTINNYISIIAETNTKKADFNFLLREVSKTSAASEQPYLYMGGLSGIKIPVTNGFELAFNNKKSGLDYVVLEIPAGDIYKVELKLLNVYEDETTQS